MWILWVYLAGVAIGLTVTKGGVGTRIVLALLWPLGPIAFVVTSAGLLVVGGVAFPVFGLILAAAAAGVWLALR
jgi:hypothetical protein